MSARGPRSIIVRPSRFSTGEEYTVISTVNLIEPTIDEILSAHKILQHINNGIKVTIRKEK